MNKLTIFFCASILVAGCSKNDSKSPSKESGVFETSTPHTETSEVSVTDGSNIEGTYIAQFETLNTQVNGTIPGSATFKRDEDALAVFVRIFAGGVSAWHQQNVYLGSRCPTLEDDLNADGFIDAVEGEKVYGKILIPLDSDISSQMDGRNFYPVGDLSGSYYYERITSFKKFFSDLKDQSTENELYAKLKEDEGFDFKGKVVVVHGVADSVELPESVATIGRRNPKQTLPIVCGVFDKLTWQIGTAEDGEIPGPTAGVEEGQDRPGEVNEERTGDDSSSTTNTTNETDSEETPTSDGET